VALNSVSIFETRDKTKQRGRLGTVLEFRNWYINFVSAVQIVDDLHEKKDALPAAVVEA